MKKPILIILTLIILLAGLLRIYDIQNTPAGLTWDEASLGYNAYSLMMTGKDEYGAWFPVNLKSFGDFKPALYAYLAIPFVGILGLNEFAVRLPSALAGIGLVIVVYLLASRIFNSKWIGISAAFFTSISPLSIMFSRAAFESNIALFLNTLGFYLFLRGKDKSKFLIFSAIAFSLSLLTYQASRLFVPLFLVILIGIYRKDLKRSRTGIAAGFIFVTFLLFTYSSTFLLGQSARLSTQNFFAYTRGTEQIDLISSEDGLNKEGTDFQILHGEWFAYTRGLFERYLIYFSPKMMFIEGDYSPRHRVPDLGVLYFFSLVLIPFGVVYLIRHRTKSGVALLLWLLIAPLPGVLSRDLINLVRVLNMTLPLVILEGVGLYAVFHLLRSRRLLLLPAGIIAGVAILLNVILYLDQYFIHAPVKYSQGFMYGHKEVFETFNTKNLSDYNKVVFTDTYGQPYIYYLFYTKYAPQKFQKQASLEQNTTDVGTIRRIDNIEFRHVYWPGDRGDKKSLFIGTLEELPDQDVKPFKEYTILSDIYFPDRQHAFRIVEIK